MQIQFDPKQLLGRISELDKVQIPNAANIALNQALFQTRKRLREEANTVFEKKTPFTINSFLYEKPKQRGDDLEGRVFVRDDAPGGNAPSRYLDPHIRDGKKAYSTRFQRALERTVVTQIDGRRTTAKQQATMMSPSASKIAVRRNKYGNMTPGQYGQILSGLKGGVSSADFMGGGDPSSSAIGKNYDLAYTYLDEESLADPYFKNRFTSYGAKPGIYRIIRQSNPAFKTRAKGDTSTTRTVTRYYRVMTERSIPTYSSKFKFFDLSLQTIEQEFVKRFRDNILR